MARADATVDNITLLRDFVAWESRKLLRNRAKVILRRMEDQARQVSEPGRSHERKELELAIRIGEHEFICLVSSRAESGPGSLCCRDGTP